MSRSVRVLLLAALAAAAVAMVAPTPTVVLGTGYLPGWCTTSYDLDGWATLDCTPGIVTSTVDPTTTSGIGEPARALVAAAVVLVVLALRRERGRTGGPGRRSTLLLRAALVVTAAAAVVGGLGGAARLAMVAATLALALALRSWGALPSRHRAVGGEVLPA